MGRTFPYRGVTGRRTYGMETPEQTEWLALLDVEMRANWDAAVVQVLVCMSRGGCTSPGCCCA